MDRFEIQPVLRCGLPEVAQFLYRWREGKQSAQGVAGGPGEADAPQKPVGESVFSIERRLQWLLLENPSALADGDVGYCLRDGEGRIRGLSLHFPVTYLAGDRQLSSLCSGSFFVETAARSMGFYLFKKFLRTPGHSFYFASTCNAVSSELWKNMGGCPVPISDTEYILPLRLDAVMPALVAARTSSQVAAGVARWFGRGANPILRLLTRSSSKLSIEACQDWEKLSALAVRHRSPEQITSNRQAALLRWRYGAGSPAHPCGTYTFRDPAGNEGWFALGDLTRGTEREFRESVLLDVVWPREQMSYESIFPEIARVAAESADVMYLRWQPGIDYRGFSRCVIPHKLAAPRAFVSVPKGTARFPLDSLDYDDSDYIAWRFQWAHD